MNRKLTIPVVIALATIAVVFLSTCVGSSSVPQVSVTQAGESDSRLIVVRVVDAKGNFLPGAQVRLWGGPCTEGTADQHLRGLVLNAPYSAVRVRAIAIGHAPAFADIPSGDDTAEVSVQLEPVNTFCTAEVEWKGPPPVDGVSVAGEFYDSAWESGLPHAWHQWRFEYPVGQATQLRVFGHVCRVGTVSPNWELWAPSDTIEGKTWRFVAEPRAVVRVFLEDETGTEYEDDHGDQPASGLIWFKPLDIDAASRSDMVTYRSARDPMSATKGGEISLPPGRYRLLSHKLNRWIGYMECDIRLGHQTVRVPRKYFDFKWLNITGVPSGETVGMRFLDQISSLGDLAATMAAAVDTDDYRVKEAYQGKHAQFWPRVEFGRSLDDASRECRPLVIPVADPGVVVLPNFPSIQWFALAPATGRIYRAHPDFESGSVSLVPIPATATLSISVRAADLWTSVPDESPSKPTKGGVTNTQIVWHEAHLYDVQAEAWLGRRAGQGDDRTPLPFRVLLTTPQEASSTAAADDRQMLQRSVSVLPGSYRVKVVRYTRSISANRSDLIGHEWLPVPATGHPWGQNGSWASGGLWIKYNETMAILPFDGVPHISAEAGSTATLVLRPNP